MLERARWRKVKSAAPTDEEWWSPSGAYFIILEDGVGGTLYTAGGEEIANSFNKDKKQCIGELLLEFNRKVVKDLQSLKRLAD